MLAKIRKLNAYKVIGIALILTGLGVLLYIPATWVLGYFEQRSLRGDYEQQSAASLSLNQSVLDKLQGAADLEKLRQLAIAYKARLESEQTIAQLEIPKIGINVIVVEGTSESALRQGPGLLEETPLPGMTGNFAVAGDRVLYGGPFLNIDELEAGDEIILHTQYGNFNYAVFDKYLTDPEDTSVTKSHDYEEITLITCDPPWGTSKRLIVKGKLSSASLRQS
jgi:sortase A